MKLVNEFFKLSIKRKYTCLLQHLLFLKKLSLLTFTINAQFPCNTRMFGLDYFFMEVLLAN